MNRYLDVSEEVAVALKTDMPVVALESTIISHGMPWPRNLETALAVEQAVREEGAVPATIAIIRGRIKIGLTREELQAFADGSLHPIKVSRRDLPAVIARQENGATTVAGTMIAAAMAGIRVFATGGIGGVHRGAEHSWDVSADLEELAMTSVAVVCAGAKAILDLPKTTEYLETRGVPVIGYGTDELPAFYSRESGIALSLRADTPEAVARMLAAKWNLGLAGGAVIANPIPNEQAMPGEIIEKAISTALAELAPRNIQGAAVTPYLLARVAELTGGDSLDSNIALVMNNARLAARIAAALTAMED
ncbi:MAG: pseudouridine-5'-phosphate glycosidase [Rectinemataceae bacterium]|nr:pseudouridine-5'-phosphate glycosidase [Spirochaetaceae bacterium]